MRLKYWLLLLSANLVLSGCSSMLSSATEDFGQSLSSTLLNYNDPQTVAAALPAYLLIQEALLKQELDSQALLVSTATLYRAYSGLIEEDEQRLAALSEKALELSLQAACMQKDDFCQLQKLSYAEFESIIKHSTTDDLSYLYDLGASWALWIQARKTNWEAIAQLAQVKALMQQVLQLNDNYQQGMAHVYLGVLASLLPEATGGEPKLAKEHFEKALKLSAGKNLMVKVLYAKHYARMTFDRALHDKLLNEVIKSEVKQPDLTLTNIAAKQQAQQLLKSADDYF